MFYTNINIIKIEYNFFICFRFYYYFIFFTFIERAIYIAGDLPDDEYAIVTTGI